MNNRPAQEKMEQQASNGENLMPMLAASAASRLVRDILGRLNSPYAEAAARPMRPALLWRQVARRLGLLQEQSSASFLPAPNSGTPRPHFIWRARPLRRALSEDGQWTEEPVLTLGPQIEPGRHVTSVVAPVVAPPVIVPVQSSPALALPAEATADSLPDVTPAAAPRSALTSSPALAGPTTEPLPAPDVAMPDEVAQSHLGPSLAEPAASIQPATSSDIAPQAPATPNIMTPPDVARPIEQAMSTGAPQRSSVPLPAAAADLLQPPTFIMPDAQQSRDSTGAQRAEQLSVTPTEMQPQASETRPHEAAAPAPLPSATLPFDTSAQSAPSLPAAFETGQAAESAPPRFVPTRVVRVTYTQGPAVALPAPLANANTSISRPGIATPLVARLYGAEPLPAFGDPPQSAGQAEFTHARSTSQRRRQSVTLEEAPFAQVSDDSNVARVAFTRRPIIAADNPLVPAADLLARMEYRSVLEAARSDEPMEQPPEQLVGDLSLHQQIVAAAASAEAPTPLPMPLAAPGTRQPSALQVDSLSQSTQPARGPVARMLDKALAVLPLPQSLRRAANPDVQEMPSVVQSHELLSNAPAPATSYIPPQVEALPTDNPVQLPVVEQRTIGEAGHEASMRAATPADFTQEEYRPIVQPDLISAIDSSSYVPAEESATHAGSPNYSAEANQSTALQPAATEADSLPAPLAVSVPAGSSPESAAQAVPGGGESGAASLTPPVVGTPAVPSVPPATSANFYVLPVQPVEETTTTSQSPGEALTGVSDEPVERVGTQGFVGAIINRLLRRADAPAETESSGSQPLSMPWRRSSRQQKANKVDYTNFEDLSGGAATPQPSKSEDRADVFPSRELSLGSTRASYSEPAPSVTATAAYGPDSSPVAAPIQAAPANLAAFESTDVAPILDATSTTAPPLDATAPALADPPSVAAPEALAGEAIGWPGVASQVNVPKASREATFDVSEDLFSPPQVEEGAEVEASRMQEATYTPPQPSFSFSVDEGAEPDAAASEVWASMPEVAQEVSRAHVPLTGFSPLITVLRSGGLLGRVYGSRAAATVPGQEELVSEGQRATRSASEVPSATPVNYAAGSPATGVLGTPTGAGLTSAYASRTSIVLPAVLPATRGASAQLAISPTVPKPQPFGSNLPITALSRHAAQGMIGQSSRLASLAPTASPQGVTAFVPAATRPSMVMRTPQQMSSTLAPYVAEDSSADLLMDAGEVETLLHSLYAPDPMGLDMPLAIPYTGFASAPEEIAYPQQAGADQLFGGYAAETSVSSTDEEWAAADLAFPEPREQVGWPVPSRSERSAAATITDYSWGPGSDDAASNEASVWADVVASAVDSGPGISAPSYAPALALAGDERAQGQPSQGGGGGGGGGQQEEQRTAEGSKPGPDPAELDALADTVYDIIRRRITVERERYLA